MIGFEIELDHNPKQSCLDALSAGLNEHSASFVEKPGFQAIAFFARDQRGEMLGGIYGRINWNWLSVSLLWVGPEYRGNGLGATLLKHLETEALASECMQSHVDTFSFQAQEFYIANGYEVFAELPNYPDTHRRVYLKKALSPAQVE